MVYVASLQLRHYNNTQTITYPMVHIVCGSGCSINRSIFTQIGDPKGVTTQDKTHSGSLKGKFPFRYWVGWSCMNYEGYESLKQIRKKLIFSVPQHRESRLKMVTELQKEN